MEHKIFLLGNGFDLFHKLPTRYDCFLHTIEFLINHYDISMYSVGDIFRDERLQEKNYFIKESYKRYFSGYNEVDINPVHMEDLADTAKNNMWFKYLLSSLDRNIGWIDFEQEIRRVIHVFMDVFEQIYQTGFSLNELSDEACYIISRFDYFFDTEVQVDVIGSPMMKIKEEYILEQPYGSGNYVANQSKIVSILFDELRELAYLLAQYLRYFVDDTVEVLMEKGLIQKASIFNVANSVISFNYTKTWQRVYSEVTNVHHIHGQIENEIVLGVDSDEYDELDQLDTTFLSFKKYFQRVFYKTDVSYIKEIKDLRMTASIMDKEYQLCVFGHSLDVTDQEVIRELFEVADRIRIAYHSADALNSYIRNLVAIFGKIEFDRLRVQKDLQFLPLE